MYLHKQFIKEHIGGDKQAQSDFAFFLLLKSKLSNGIIYKDTTTTWLSKLLGDKDRRTIIKYMTNLKSRGWIKPSGKHLKLKSINKEYEYKITTNGKAVKNKNSKYFRVRIRKEYTLKQIRNIIRGLLVKPHYQKELFVNIKGKMEHFSKKGLKRMWDSAYTLGYKRKDAPLAEKSAVTIPIRFIGKAMGVSKSTAYRVVTDLSKDKFITKNSFTPIYKGLKEKLIKDKKLTYGIYIFNNNVYHKPVCSYVFWLVRTKYGNNSVGLHIVLYTQ